MRKGSLDITFSVRPYVRIELGDTSYRTMHVAQMSWKWTKNGPEVDWKWSEVDQR